MEWVGGDQVIVMTSDNSGGIGEKPLDEVKVPYDMVAYYAFRTALMDCFSAGAVPVSVVIHNFCGDAAWTKLESGVKQGLAEIGADAAITGSTESNMTLQQSAVAVTVIGERVRDFSEVSGPLEWSLAGKPLVGMEVVEEAADVAPLSLARSYVDDPSVAVIWPAGSKGIAAEWMRMCEQLVIDAQIPDFSVDVNKSAGPATCWIVGRRSAVD
ncbi:ATP-binding protein [Jeotgalibacillus haloalkalitolerans]|uniref:ATP-binding protein n=1 Tax=Jeotgalibacillus haloalkalitolerans TaxID=3104292 RepID=A0ABU5KJ01_9BACL|nr:ATP-binding protein [Jeotgalibacillus sp. HH7-29]MDZ5711198.1 ATP-binding protein [Jeotgalibacillus sp. HH7-29]